MSIASFVEEARDEVPRLVTGILDHQLKHAAVYYVAHRLAATHYRTRELRARMDGERAKAGWYRLRAWHHRRARERFRRLVVGLDKAERCKGLLSCLDL